MVLGAAGASDSPEVADTSDAAGIISTIAEEIESDFSETITPSETEPPLPPETTAPQTEPETEEIAETTRAPETTRPPETTAAPQKVLRVVSVTTPCENGSMATLSIIGKPNTEYREFLHGVRSSDTTNGWSNTQSGLPELPFGQYNISNCPEFGENVVPQARVLMGIRTPDAHHMHMRFVVDNRQKLRKR